MARARVVVTQSWQQIAVGAAVFTIDIAAHGAVYFNEAQDDSTANKVYPKAGEQFSQSVTVPTYVKAEQLGWELIADGAI